MVPFTMEHRYEPKHPEVLRINPKRQVPVLVHGAVEIFDSTEGVTPRLLAWRERLMARPAVDQFVRQFADSLARYQLRIPDFVQRATGG
jgi:glutathione S-transferase